MKNNPLPRIDLDESLQEILLPYCRLKPGQIWHDKIKGHKIGCFDATHGNEIIELLDGDKAALAVHDPPYNFVAFQQEEVSNFIQWSRLWIANTVNSLSENGSLYIWLGADQNNGFQPLPDFMIMMRDFPLSSRSFITMRNQRGYGTLKNWMSVRQELLYYVQGKSMFNVDAEYTDIPKILRGYYKEINGTSVENFERSRSDTIRAGNVWVDVQQIFYRLEENVSGCYAQKPIKSIERIVKASSNPGDLVLDFFAHSGTTLLASERLGRRCYTIDNNPIFCEIAIRRLEHYRETGRLGWQNGHPFEAEYQSPIVLVAGESIVTLEKQKIGRAHV